MTIPVIDLAEFTNDNAVHKTAFVQQLGKAYEDVGFVAVKNHGISDELITDLYKHVQQFFSLPLEQKRKYEIPELAGQRGYTSFGKEHAKGSDAPDLKEFFQYGQIVTANHPLKKEYPDNVSVNEIDGFDEYIEDGNSIVRAIHYPPITSEPKSAIRAEQHEDINLITLLVGASAGGLEILTKTNEWVPVTSLPEQIVVNVGDMLQRLTNNQLKSTTHRVVNPPRELWHTSRFSIPFFLHPKSTMSLASLSNCINEQHLKQYEDITAGEYLDERLREIGLKK